MLNEVTFYGIPCMLVVVTVYFLYGKSRRCRRNVCLWSPVCLFIVAAIFSYNPPTSLSPRRHNLDLSGLTGSKGFQFHGVYILPVYLSVNS